MLMSEHVICNKKIKNKVQLEKLPTLNFKSLIGSSKRNYQLPSRIHEKALFETTHGNLFCLFTPNLTFFVISSFAYSLCVTKSKNEVVPFQLLKSKT